MNERTTIPPHARKVVTLLNFLYLACQTDLQEVSADARRTASVLTLTLTSMPSSSSASPQYEPERGIACEGVRATPTRIRSRLPTIPFVGSNSTHPDPGT